MSRGLCGIPTQTLMAVFPDAFGIQQRRSSSQTTEGALHCTPLLSLPLHECSPIQCTSTCI
eukprot:363781-Chlamydomonas_euryale.AAC.6